MADRELLPGETMTDPKTRERAAEEYAESCDNAPGSFLSYQLEAIRKKAHLAGQSVGFSACEAQQAERIRENRLWDADGQLRKLHDLLDQKDSYIAKLEACVQYFVDRCEGKHPDGPIRSTRTYAIFKAALGDGERCKHDVHGTDCRECYP